MKNKISTALFLCMSPFSLYAANMTNQIIGVGAKDNLINPYICIQNGNGQVTYALEPGKSVDANKYADNAYYVGATLRFGGCDYSNTYLGYIGFSLSDAHTNKISQYSPPEGVHIAYTKPNIDAQGVVTGEIHYTPIKPNFNLLTTPPTQNKTWPFVGANLSGLEFSKILDPVVVPNLSQEDVSSNFSDLYDTQSFLKAGMNTMRIPLSWGYLQLEGAGKGEINSDYYDSYVKPLLETLTSAKVYTMLDLHAYMRYSIFGQQYSGCGADGVCPDGTLVLDPKAYQDVWSKLYTLIKNDPKIDKNYLLLDLVNEPVDVPDDLVFSIQTEVIKTLRSQGFNGYILVEGNAWTGLHSWTTVRWTARDGKTTYTNASLFTRENFKKAGIEDLDKIIINVHQYLDSDYSGTHESCQTDLSTGGDNGFNLQLFADYLKQNHLKAMITEFGSGRDSNTCAPATTSLLNYMQENAAADKDYGFIGWTIWSTGHGWGDYNLRVKPNSYQMQSLKSFL